MSSFKSHLFPASTLGTRGMGLLLLLCSELNSLGQSGMEMNERYLFVANIFTL